MSLASGADAYTFDVYTVLGGGRAVGITDGLAATDRSSAAKLRRESAFPLALAHRSLSIRLQAAQASVERQGDGASGLGLSAAAAAAARQQVHLSLTLPLSLSLLSPLPLTSFLCA